MFASSGERDSSHEGREKDVSEDERLKEAFMGMLDQTCGYWVCAACKRADCKHYSPDGWSEKRWEKGKTFVYDSDFLSAYGAALDLAVEFGWIKKEQVMR